MRADTGVVIAGRPKADEAIPDNNGMTRGIASLRSQ